MATIKDVASRANVSVATVSRVINNAENVGEAYRDAVRKAMEELHYQPNLSARSLKGKPYHIIGIIVTDFSTPFFEKIIKNIEKAFRADGDLVLFFNTYDDPAAEKKGIDFMLEHQADVILISSTGGNEEYLDKLQANGTRILLLDRKARSHSFPSVYADKRSATKSILQYLKDHGHSRIAVITGPRSLTSNYDRYLGAMDFLYEQELPQDTVCFSYGAFTEEYGYQTIQQMLQSHTLPSAIIAGSANIVSGILLACKDNGIRVPEDLSLVSFGDLSFGQLIEPRLTYVTDEHEQISKDAIEGIRASFRGELEKRQIVVKSKLVENASVK